MKTTFLAFILLLGCTGAQSQFKNDNVLFKTIDPFELCRALEKSPGYILLDVRSKGEYEDSSSSGLNIGRFKNAININVRELGQRIHELDAYKGKPVFVYCSHSQRSRRASKMLSDSGFTNINNINGGVTGFHYLAALDQKCLQDIYETQNKFTYISPADVCKKLTKNRQNIFILDVRSDSLFRHISTDEGENALGNIREAVNIPLDSLQNNFSKIPADKEIVITELYNSRAVLAAQQLAAKGYKKLYVLIEGMDRWVSMDAKQTGYNDNWYVPAVRYDFLPVTVFGMLMNAPGNHPTIIDIRTAEEFTNKHKDYYRNTGHIKGAVNIPSKEMEKRWQETGSDKNATIVLYGFSSGGEASGAASLLVKNGFNNVAVLCDGIFGVRWTANNISGYGWLNKLVEDIPESNK